MNFTGKHLLLMIYLLPVIVLPQMPVTWEGGGHFGLDWFFVDWETDVPEMLNAHINVKELMTVFLAAARWAPLWAGKHIVVRSDNSATVAAINKSTSRSSDLLPIVKELFWLGVKFDFKISAVFIPGKLNILADYLSRFHKMENVYLAKPLLLPSLFDVLYCKFHMSFNAFLLLQTLWEPIYVP
jgi:hypothetical protein